MNHDDWCNHIEEQANKALDCKLINWREVSFNWAERFQSDEPEARTVEELIAAAKDQFNAALKQSSHDY